METLDLDVLNMIANFEEQIMRNEAEEEAFERAIQHWETEGIFDDVFGG